MAFSFKTPAASAKGLQGNKLLHPSPIDDNNKPGDDTTTVFDDVRRSLNFKGELPTDPAFFVGVWTYRLGSLNSPAFAYQSFLASGAAPAKAVDGTWEQLKDLWKLNEDRSFSLWTYVEPMPEYGVEETTYSEGRFHVLLKSRDEFVLFNVDGSLIIAYTRAKDAGD